MFSFLSIGILIYAHAPTLEELSAFDCSTNDYAKQGIVQELIADVAHLVNSSNASESADEGNDLDLFKTAQNPWNYTEVEERFLKIFSAFRHRPQFEYRLKKEAKWTVDQLIAINNGSLSYRILSKTTSGLSELTPRSVDSLIGEFERAAIKRLSLRKSKYIWGDSYQLPLVDALMSLGPEGFRLVDQLVSIPSFQWPAMATIALSSPEGERWIVEKYLNHLNQTLRNAAARSLGQVALVSMQPLWNPLHTAHPLRFPDTEEAFIDGFLFGHPESVRHDSPAVRQIADTIWVKFLNDPQIENSFIHAPFGPIADYTPQALSGLLQRDLLSPEQIIAFGPGLDPYILHGALIVESAILKAIFPRIPPKQRKSIGKLFDISRNELDENDKLRPESTAGFLQTVEEYRRLNNIEDFVDLRRYNEFRSTIQKLYRKVKDPAYEAAMKKLPEFEEHRGWVRTRHEFLRMIEGLSIMLNDPELVSNESNIDDIYKK